MLLKMGIFKMNADAAYAQRCWKTARISSWVLISLQQDEDIILEPLTAIDRAVETSAAANN